MIRIQSIILLIVVKDITRLGNIYNEYARVECLKRRRSFFCQRAMEHEMLFYNKNYPLDLLYLSSRQKFDYF